MLYLIPLLIKQWHVFQASALVHSAWFAPTQRRLLVLCLRWRSSSDPCTRIHPSTGQELWLPSSQTLHSGQYSPAAFCKIITIELFGMVSLEMFLCSVWRMIYVKYLYPCLMVLLCALVPWVGPSGWETWRAWLTASSRWGPSCAQTLRRKAPPATGRTSQIRSACSASLAWHHPR